jgi:FkbM family methyltransferase
MSYSQYDEERYIAELTASCEPDRQRFLDLGAWEPKVFSNSRALYEAGWAGVVLDPSPSAILKQCAEYGNEPRIEIVSLAVGCVAGGYGSILPITITDDCVSTLLNGKRPPHPTANYYGRIYVQVVPISDILMRFGMSFGFVNIDVEGQSVDIFHEAIKCELWAECYCIEHDDRMGELCAAATAAGYALVYSNGVNAVFGRR